MNENYIIFVLTKAPVLLSSIELRANTHEYTN